MIDEVDTYVASATSEVASVPKSLTSSKTFVPVTIKKVKSTESTGDTVNAEKDCQVVYVDRPTVSQTEYR